MRDEEGISGEAVAGILIVSFVILFLAIWGTIYLMMEAGIGITYMPEQTQGTVIEKSIFQNRGGAFGGRGPDHYWLKLQRIEEEGWVEFWIRLGDTSYAEQMWNTVSLGDFCIQGAGHKNNLTRWTCQETPG